MWFGRELNPGLQITIYIYDFESIRHNPVEKEMLQMSERGDENKSID